MKENFLVDLSKQFAVDIVNLCTDIKENRKSNVLLNQILRSGTSIGANIHEANYATSKADFINKFQIALKECYETDYWLGLFRDTHMITEDEYKDMFAKCSKIRKLLIASITTAKENVKRVVYISCNPDTLARDCKQFVELGYAMSDVQPVNMFPRTGHVESVVCLKRQIQQ